MGGVRHDGRTHFGLFPKSFKGDSLTVLRVARSIIEMRTVIETPTFQRQAEKVWTEAQRTEFIDWIAANPMAGAVIPGANGARKVRWSRAGSGKSSGVRVIYFNLTQQGAVVLAMLYAKADRGNVTAGDIERGMRDEH